MYEYIYHRHDHMTVRLPMLVREMKHSIIIDVLRGWIVFRLLAMWCLRVLLTLCDTSPEHQDNYWAYVSTGSVSNPFIVFHHCKSDERIIFLTFLSLLCLFSSICLSSDQVSNNQFSEPFFSPNHFHVAAPPSTRHTHFQIAREHHLRTELF